MSNCLPLLLLILQWIGITSAQSSFKSKSKSKAGLIGPAGGGTLKQEVWLLPEQNSTTPKQQLNRQPDSQIVFTAATCTAAAADCAKIWACSPNDTGFTAAERWNSKASGLKKSLA